ncbi:hypothetical protein HID58_061237 [Brassica napus]|uniref:Uncharacterized protein n=1 Tax=Brassica napus TaxID=3708 RepID=A0ABQ7ZYW9_BRANA|nr:hypothetical protein HID58_061237 [Brassica napus]
MQIYLLTCLSATLYRAPRPWEDPSTLTSLDAVPARLPADTSGTKPRHDEKRHTRDIDERKKHKKDEKDSRKRRHDDSDSD